MKTKTIALLVYDGVQLLDVAGACDVFNEANIQSGEKLYQTELVALSRSLVTTSAGVKMASTRSLSQLGEAHTFLVTGAPEVEKVNLSSGQVRTLEKVSKSSERYGSICTGAFLLARTSILNRKRVTTHWAFADRFRELYPAVHLHPEKMFVKHGRLYTSAGVSAGIDLCLSLLEEDHGTELALRVSRQLVMSLRRPGGQMQFSHKDQLTISGRSAFDLLQKNLQKKFSKRLRDDLRVETLAAEVRLSPRHLTRLFQKELKTTPGTWVEDLRLDAAKELLEESTAASKEIAYECGFSSDNSLRRIFLRRFGITPTQYRRQFSNLF